MTARHPHLTAMDRAARERRAMAESGMDLDVEAFVRQVKALPVFRDCPRSIARTKVHVIAAAYTGGGRAHGNRMVRIRYTIATPATWLLEAIVHELVHSALPDGEVHGERFRLTLRRAARELWGIDIPDQDIEKSKNGRVRKYGLDHAIEVALEPIVLAGGYPKRAAETSETRAQARLASAQERAAKREAHARRMLARAERRLKLAKTVERRWRQKVQRYERIAAKKGTK